jgi:poly-gamma-glutamate capsule biosynthesis protein CapA/YwtB (metallophosphatase superfamily)
MLYDTRLTRRRLLALRRRRLLALLVLSVVAGAIIGIAQGCLGRGPVATGAGTRPVPPPPPKVVTLVAVGDVMLDRGVWNRIKENGVGHVMAQVRDPLRSGDLTFANLECPLSTVQGHAEPGGDLSFCADPSTVQALLDAGIDVVSLANNHAMDAGREGLEDTMRVLEDNHVAYAGARPGGMAPDEVTYLRVDDCTVAFLAYTDLTVEHGALCKVDEDMQNALARVREARNKADIVVVSYHWGEEYEPAPTPRQRALGHATIDAGADVILGHHAHVMSGVEQYSQGLILYSMGNFVFDQRDADDGRMTSAIFRLRLTPRDRIDLTVTPVRIATPEYAPRPATDERGSEILANLARLSQDLGTPLTVEGQRARASFALRPGGAGRSSSDAVETSTKGSTG